MDRIGIDWRLPYLRKVLTLKYAVFDEIVLESNYIAKYIRQPLAAQHEETDNDQQSVARFHHGYVPIKDDQIIQTRLAFSEVYNGAELVEIFCRLRNHVLCYPATKSQAFKDLRAYYRLWLQCGDRSDLAHIRKYPLSSKSNQSPYLFFESKVRLRNQTLPVYHALRNLDQLFSQILDSLSCCTTQREEESYVLELPTKLLEQVGVEMIQILLCALLGIEMCAYEDYRCA